MKIPLEKIEKTISCWNWIGTIHSKESGYGEFYFDGKKTRAHRLIYELLVGKIPKGLVLDHLCKNRKCVNPQHLEIVTIGENTLRGNGVAKKNKDKTHCIRGHLLDEKNLIFSYKKHKNWRICIKCRDIRNKLYYKKTHT